jgi:protein-tyrosine-phosphatase
MTTPYNVLFLCTGNSARSILAEALVNHWARGRFVGYSAGSHPKGEVHPLAIEVLRQYRMPTEGLRSKSWEEFARPGLRLELLDRMALQKQLDAIGTVTEEDFERLPVPPGTR